MTDSPVDPLEDAPTVPIAPSVDQEPTVQLDDTAPQDATEAIHTELADLGLALAYIVAPEGVAGQTVVYIDPTADAPALVAVDVPVGDSLTQIIIDAL